MPIVDCKIEIPEGYELAEPLPRKAKPGEIRWQTNYDIPVVHDSPEAMSCGTYFILREVWQWPEWLLAEWIAMDEDRRWWAFQNAPRLLSGSWISEDGLMSWLDPRLVDFTPPPCTDWRTSKRRNPRCEKPNSNLG